MTARKGTRPVARWFWRPGGGSGKTTLREHLWRAMAHRCSMAMITNDIYTPKDANQMTRALVLPSTKGSMIRVRFLTAMQVWPSRRRFQPAEITLTFARKALNFRS